MGPEKLEQIEKNSRTEIQKQGLVCLGRQPRPGQCKALEQYPKAGTCHLIWAVNIKRDQDLGVWSLRKRQVTPQKPLI